MIKMDFADGEKFLSGIMWCRKVCDSLSLRKFCTEMPGKYRCALDSEYADLCGVVKNSYHIST